MASTRSLIRTESCGPSNMKHFSDRGDITNINTTAISRIVVTHDDFIRSLTVHYTDKVGITRGGTGSTVSDFTMTHGEFITKVEGSFTGDPDSTAVSKIIFFTNKGTQWGPYGQVSIDSTFVWGEFGPHMELLYFTGNADTYIRSLTATFARNIGYDGQSAGVVRYEKQIDTEPDTQCQVALSKFARNLMSSTVTLLIGFDCVEFHVSQRVLCTLPFFRAALQGEFREASEQKIEMPEDEPQIISALVEFLCTGSYTYAYPAQGETDSDTPPRDLEEGSFHVDVYATAFKYDCQGLVKESLASFVRVLRKLKDFEVIRLWKAAYAKQLLLSTVRDDPNLAEFRRGLAGSLNWLYIRYGKEMERTAEEHPALINDLLRMVVSEGGGLL